MEKAFIRKASQEDKTKEKLVSKSSDKLTKKQKEKLALQAMIEFGDNAVYEVRKGTRGMGLFAYADSREDSSVLRKLIPSSWNGLYTIVIYSDLPEEYEDEDLYDPY